jgi:hypothetical protein
MEAVSKAYATAVMRILRLNENIISVFSKKNIVFKSVWLFGQHGIMELDDDDRRVIEDLNELGFTVYHIIQTNEGSMMVTDYLIVSKNVLHNLNFREDIWDEGFSNREKLEYLYNSIEYTLNGINAGFVYAHVVNNTLGFSELGSIGVAATSLGILKRIV